MLRALSLEVRSRRPYCFPSAPLLFSPAPLLFSPVCSVRVETYAYKKKIVYKILPCPRRTRISREPKTARPKIAGYDRGSPF